MTVTIPENADAIDAGWLERALEARHPGVRVASVDVVERHEVTNAHARLQVRYDAAAGAPERFFCKLLPNDPARRGAIAATGMGPREARFYADLAPKLRFRVPETHVALYDDAGGFALLLEDLRESGCQISDGTVGVSPDAAAEALEALAELHVRFEDPARRQAEAGWVPRPQHSDYGERLLQQGLDAHPDKLSDRFAALARLYIARGAELHRLWQEGPQTVIHGDAHIGNLFDDAGTVGFLDWGILQCSTPLRDASYFLCMALDIEDRRTREEELLRHYLAVRGALGGVEIDFDDAWRSHRIHAAYCVPACCQIVTFPENASPARRVFSGAFLARAEAALEDLEPQRALAEVGLSP